MLYLNKPMDEEKEKNITKMVKENDNCRFMKEQTNQTELDKCL